MKKYIILLSICLLFNCCNNTTSINNNAMCIIPVSENNLNEKMLYSTLFDSMKYVALETSDDVLIKELTRIKYFNNKIFILDKFVQSLFIFDMNGKLIKKIHHKGIGPKDYSQLYDFGIDEENNKLVLFSYFEKIQIYDIDGNFINEYKLPLRGTSLIVDNSKIYFYTKGLLNSINGKEWKYNLLVLNDKGIEKGELPIEREFDRIMTYNSTNAFCKYGGEIQLFISFSNNIYAITREDEVYVKYCFDFGKYNLPDNYFKNNTIDDISESKYAYGLNSYWTNTKYCFFKITFDSKYHEILYSIEDKKLYDGLYDNIAYCFPSIYQATDTYIVGARQAEDLFNEYNFKKKDRKNTIVEKIVSAMDETDNPVIFFYYFK